MIVVVTFGSPDDLWARRFCCTVRIHLLHSGAICCIARIWIPTILLPALNTLLIDIISGLPGIGNPAAITAAVNSALAQITGTAGVQLVVNQILADVRASLIIFADCLAERETNGIVAGSSIVGIQIPAIQQMAPTIQQMNPTVQQNSQAVYHWRPNVTTTIIVVTNIIDSVYNTQFFYFFTKKIF